MQLLFLTYSNSQQSPLPTLQEEDDQVHSILSRREKERHFRLARNSNASIPTIAEYLQRYQKDITLFHYSGHAGRDQLLVREEAANADGIAQLLGRCEKLRLVVLNGCSTRGQVDELLRLGVPVVIATSAPVGDRTAAQFAISFYQAMAEDKKPVREAFEDGVAAAQAQSRGKLRVERTRGGFAVDEESYDQPLWGLHWREESDLEWTLPKAIAQKLNAIPGINARDVVGRSEDLAHLKARLGSSASLLLMNGIGGIGKTTLAKFYVNQHGEQYDRLAWMEQREDLAQSFATDTGLQASLGIRQEQGETFDEVCYRMLLALQNMEGKNLLVLDNVDQSLRDWSGRLPHGPHWHVLLTSRQVIGSYELMELGKLDPGSARELFLKHCTKPQDEAALNAFLEKIEYHTLSIELFAKILEAHWEMETVGELSAYLDTNHLDAETLQTVVDIEHARGQTTLYRHLLQAFDLSGIEQRPELMRLLKQMAALPPSVEGYAVKDLMEWLGIEKKKTEFFNHLQELYRIGWILQPKKNHFVCHRLIKTIVEHAKPAEEKDLEVLVEKIAIKLSLDQEKDNPIDKFPWISFGWSLLNSLKHLEFENKIALRHNLAMILRDSGEFLQAKILLEEAIKEEEKILGPENQFSATMLGHLAMIMSNLGDYFEAKRLAQNALNLHIKHFGNDHPKTAIYYSDLGVILHNLKQFSQAKDLLEKAVDLNEKTFGPNSIHTVVSYTNLALVLRSLKDYQRAKSLLLKSLDYTEEKYGSNHPATDSVYGHLSMVLNELGQHQEALVFAYKSMQFNENNFGVDHTSTAICYVGVADIFQDLGESKAAKELYEYALSVFENKLGVDHPYVRMVEDRLKELSFLDFFNQYR